MAKVNELLAAALANASSSSAQVVKSVSEYLAINPDDLLQVYASAKSYYDATYSVVSPSGGCHEYILRSDDISFQVKGQSDFRVVASSLPEIIIEDCHRFQLDLRGLSVRLSSEKRAKIQVRLNNCSGFSVLGGHILNSRNLLCVSSCQQFQLLQVKLEECEGFGFILFNCSLFEVKNCIFKNGLAAGIYCLGNTSYGVIEDNNFYGSQGFLNCDAGLHINHCTQSLAKDMIPDNSHEDAKITEKTLKPRFLFVRGNAFFFNRAQGIYAEGCLFSLFEQNMIHSNNKEGICFDWGCAFNYFKGNSLAFNGERAALSREEIKADAIEQYPLLPDGSSSCKLPAISIDNGALNIIDSNVIFRNHGGGIKMVRSGIANIVVGNTFMDNCLGVNEHFRAFHAVTLLAMGSETEFDPDYTNLDFMPSKGNIISRNLFSGELTYMALYAVPGCVENAFSDDNVCSQQAISPQN